MVIKYCEFEPTQHRNKRVAMHVFLDAPDDPHPLAICDVCTKKLLQMRPEAIVMERKEFEKQKKAGKKPAAPAAADAAAPEAAGDAPAEGDAGSAGEPASEPATGSAPEPTQD